MLGDELNVMFMDAADPTAVEAYAKRQGAFDLSAEELAKSDQVEATLEAMYLMAASDGEVAPEELHQLSASLRAMLEPFEAEGSALYGLPLLRLDRQLSVFAEALEAQGHEARLASVAQRLTTEDSRCLAFCMAAGVALVDDFVASGEADAIERFAAAFQLSADESQHLLREVHERMSGA